MLKLATEGYCYWKLTRKKTSQPPWACCEVPEDIGVRIMKEGRDDRSVVPVLEFK